MNYVILNGVKSDTIKGLLIQSLPTVSKPLIRAEVETIDGRDGDIVTKLGYSAYDKAMSIGLYGDFDIDDVIQYFDSEGTVTFSNEPDKYYNYQIVEQIDFERLIRFRTATVTFHVQPFKYSAVDESFEYKNNFVSVSDYSATKNGVTVTANNGTISVKGTALTATEFYVPVTKQSLQAGSYTLNATVTGTTANVCSIRLIKTAPSNADSLGWNYLPLYSDATVQLSGQVTNGTVYGYLWFYFNPKGAMNFTLDVTLTNSAYNSISIRNIGNTFSRPTITIYGSGTVALNINGLQVLTLDFGGAEYITIDTVQMNAYQNGVLMNRNVIGNYENVVLKIGTNTISWSGTVSGIEIENFSRWI